MKLACGRSRITILLFTLLVAVACGSGSALDAILEEGSARGVIVEVQHQLLGEGILVSYVAKDEILLAVDLAD